MIYLNKNVTLNQLKEVVRKNISQSINYMSDDFNIEQKHALELFQKRINLEEIIEESIKFNRNISWENSNANLKLTTTAEELINVFKLRSDVYRSKNYQNEFIDEIEGLNFDKFDKSSAIIYYQNNNEITGTVRVIYDSKNLLPTEKVHSYNSFRQDKKKIAELSRCIVKKDGKGLKLDFKHLINGLYNICMHEDNKIDLAVVGFGTEIYKLYSKFGGITIEKELDTYGSLKIPNMIISWDMSQASTFFKKAFLT